MPTEAREIAPVAEVVERLRSIGGPTREEAADLLERQQAEIERLSRERDTGVPEGWRLVPMIGAEVRADHPITSLNPDPTFEVFAIRAEADQRLYVRGENTCWFNIDGIAPAAAPQPPTVSPDIVALTRERDQLKEELERAYKVDDQKTREINILTGENRKVYRERDQAREALELAEPILAAVSMLLREDRILVCRDEILTAALQRARSVLDPEKEEKA